MPDDFHPLPPSFPAGEKVEKDASAGTVITFFPTRLLKSGISLLKYVDVVRERKTSGTEGGRRMRRGKSPPSEKKNFYRGNIYGKLLFPKDFSYKSSRFPNQFRKFIRPSKPAHPLPGGGGGEKAFSDAQIKNLTHYFHNCLRGKQFGRGWLRNPIRAALPRRRVHPRQTHIYAD